MDDIKVPWPPKAKKTDLAFCPMPGRPYETFLRNNRKDVTSQYVGATAWS